MVEARDRLRAEGIDTDYLRLRALPMNGVTRDFIEQHDRVYVVENNTDGQMAKLVRMEYPGPRATRLFTGIFGWPALDAALADGSRFGTGAVTIWERAKT